MSYFSPVVDKAIEDIYYCYDTKRAAAAQEALKQASAQGDGDASYILSRCASGPQYSWAYHPFKEDDDEVERLVRLSIVQGSAIGVLGAMRVGMLTPEMEDAMPYKSLREAWDTVYQKARDGSLFCQNMIGNTYFWLDIPRIDGIGPDSFPKPDEFRDYLQKTTLACIPWFEKAFKGGMGFAGKNLYNLYNNGEKGWLAPQPEKAMEVAKMGADLGYPDWREIYGERLMKIKGREAEGLSLCQAAADVGQLSAWYDIGRAYQNGLGVPADVHKALECYEKGLADIHAVGCANCAGELYFKGQNGIPQDYARAVELFERAHAENNYWGNDMHGLCRLLGLGCTKDPVAAKKLFDEANYSSDIKNYGLGLIYTNGLGVTEDIKKGVEYFQKASKYPPAQEAMLKFKKTLFGKWKRR